MRTRTTAALVSALLAVALTACSGDTEGKATDVPSYKIVQQDTGGDNRDLVVEVESPDGLEAVFNNVAGRLTDEADYLVVIKCSMGETADVDARLATGTVVVGSTGKVREAEFQPDRDRRTCPKD